uniref:Uncharacterized protein n=1 Tax=Knipowitschia caucasica TaxID=637954 RepID=A0AAV2MFS6_KNICA
MNITRVLFLLLLWKADPCVKPLASPHREPASPGPPENSPPLPTGLASPSGVRDLGPEDGGRLSRSSSGSGERRRRVLSLTSCFAGGVFFATCLLDLLPDYLEGINKAFSNAGITLQFPLPEFIIAMGFFMVLILEQIMLSFKHSASLSGPEERRSLLDSGQDLSQDSGHGHGHSHGHSQLDLSPQSALRAFILVFSLSLHSVFEGLAVGLVEQDKEVLELSLALLIHKSLIALSLSSRLLEGGVRRALCAGCVLLFAVMTPLGIAVGVGFTEETRSSPHQQMVRSSLEGVATGTFFYITFMEILPHELQGAPQHNMPKSDMSGAGCGPGPGAAGGPSTGASNPRKFSEKIALHTQRQAEETAAFQEVMMDISSTRLQAQKLRLARNQGPYYGGSLPNVNQIGRNPQEYQGSFSSALDSSRSTRHHGLVERVQRERRFMSPVRPYRNRPVDNSPYNASYLSPPPDPSWRRTNSDSALHTSVMNPPAADPFTTGGHTLTPQNNRRTGQNDVERARMFPYPVPPIEENVLNDGKLLKPWDNKKFPMLSSRPKSCEVPDINIFSSPEQPSPVLHNSALNTLNSGGSLPDLSILHFPSPLPTPLDQDEPYPGPSPLSGGSSTGNLASTLTQLGINAGSGGGYQQQHNTGLLTSLQSALSNPSLPSSLSNPNLHSFTSLHSSNSNPSLQSSLSNPSLQSSLSSSPSSLSSQSLHSSLSSSSLQSGAGNPSYTGGVGGTSLSTSPRRRAQLSPLILPLGAEPRRHHAKQFSPTMSPTLSSITQGVPLDTSKLPVDQRLPPFPLSQNQQRLHTQQMQQMHNLRNSLSHQPQHHYANTRALNTHSSPLIKSEMCLDQCGSSTSCPNQLKQEAESDQRRTLPQLQQISHNLATDLYNDALFNSLLDDPFLNLQFTGKSNQQFSPDPGSDGLHHSALSCHGLERTHSMEDQNQNQSHVYGADTRHNVPNIILTGDSPPGLSKEIASALSHVPGFEMDPFSLDDPLRIDPLALDMLEGDLMLADPAVEDSFRSDRLK